MQHLTVSGRSLLVGDEVAGLLVDYGATVATAGRADSVLLQALRPDGHPVAARILLNAGTGLVAESTASAHDEPDNTELTGYLRDRLRFYGVSPGGDLGLDTWPRFGGLIGLE